MANKKINQLVSKTAILSTDIFGIGDATTGQLFKKTIAELQAAIGGAVISVNGLVGTVVLDTDDIQELATPTNKYFTDARARGAISLTVTGNSGASTYSSGTGVLNVPTYTLAGLGGISATFLSGTSGISYNSTTGVISYSGTVYTDASIRALFSGATGISYNSTTGAISYSGTVYTDASVRALISITTTGTSGASTYNNTTGVINVPNYTLAGLGGISLTSLSGGTGITYNNTTGAISYSGTVYTDASVRALISASGAVSYNNTTGVISLTSGNLTEATSSVLTITGGTGAVLGSGTSIQVKQASSTVSGFLSSTDFNTFNGKANALSGTTNYVAKFTSSTGIGNSLIYDDGVGRILINSTTDNNLGDNGNKGFLINSGGAGLFSFISFRTSNSDRGIFRVNDSELMIGTQTTIPMRFETNNVERIRILSTGNVGIGTTAASTALHVAQSNDGNVAITVQNTNASYNSQYRWLNSAGTQTAAITWIQSASSLRFNNNGYDSIEITNAGVIDLKFNTTIGKSIDASSYLNFSENQISRTGNGLFYINADYSGAVSICSGGGNLLLGTATNNGERLYVSGSIRATGTITANSDITLKKNLLKIENALEKVEQINGYTYELKADDSKRHGGVIAQEMEKVFPEIVNTGNDGLMGVEYGNISALLIEAIKEQQTQIKELQALLNK
jgi:hypothetical protein